MTRIFAILLSLLLAVMPCLAENTAPDITGRWYLTLAGYHDSPTAFDAASAGLAMDLEFRADGTASLVMPEGAFSATWKTDGTKINIYVENDTLEFTLSDDGKYIYAFQPGGLDLYFERSASVSVAPAAVVAAEDPAAFAGQWNISVIVIEDNFYDMDYFTARFGEKRLAELGFRDGSVSVEGLTARLFSTQYVPMLTFTADGRMSGNTAEGKPVVLTLYADGRMGVTFAGIVWLCDRQ